MLIGVGSEHILLWITIEPINKEILALDITQKRNMLIEKRFLSTIAEDYGKHPVSPTDGGT